LQLFNEEEEPDQEEQIEVPQVLVSDVTVAIVNSTGGFRGEVIDLPDATVQKLPLLI